MQAKLVPTPLQVFESLVVPGTAAAPAKNCNAYMQLVIFFTLFDSSTNAYPGTKLPPNTIELVEGENLVGRESLTNISDRRLSRVQLKILWNKEESRATIERVCTYKLNDMN